MNDKLKQVQREIARVVLGKQEVIDTILMAVLANGHVLLEDLPGVGKTTLALAFSKALSLQYHRMQFTPDVLPADVTGFSMYNKQSQQFEYREGAVMCNLFLADEINRTSPKTQSALLEVMEEGTVTVDGVTRQVPDPFFVIATQNPLGSIGTQKLPESQLDRFMIRLTMGYPDIGSETAMLRDETKEMLSGVNRIITIEELQQMQQDVAAIYVTEEMYEYIAKLAWETRKNPLIETGMSPRGSKALLRMARAHAYMQERDFLVPEDCLSVFVAVAGHRIVLNAKAKAQGKTMEEVLKMVMEAVPMPKKEGKHD